MKRFFKKIYGLIPFKKNFYVFLKLIWRPPRQIYQHLHFIGTFTVKTSARRSFRMRHYGYQVENDIFWAGLTGEWERQSLGLWLKLCQHSHVIFDVGANTGIYSLIAKTENPRSDVHAFEPITRVYDKLMMNNALNHYNIHCVNLAVSNSTGIATIYDSTAEHEYTASLSSHSTISVNQHKMLVETTTLDDYVDSRGLPGIDLLKVDVESFEPEVLEGFSRGLRKFKPSMLVEVLSEETGRRIEALLPDSGYCFFDIDEEGGITQVDSIRKSSGYNYLICTQAKAKEIGLQVKS